jgi:hypothetical protein
MKKITFISLSCFSLFLFSCSRDGSGKCTETNISTVSRSSHNAGKDCASCHSGGNPGRGCFSICGTAFQKDKSSPMQNAVMVLFSKDENGKITDVSKPIPLDKSGNFYTTETISFANKYPAIISGKDTTMMGGSLTNTASCNSCHKENGTQEPIYSYK